MLHNITNVPTQGHDDMFMMIYRVGHKKVARGMNTYKLLYSKYKHIWGAGWGVPNSVFKKKNVVLIRDSISEISP